MQARANDYDAIVVGGGHNGLVSGAYFSRAGARTVVLEAREKTGGAADTSAPFADHPEVRVSTYSDPRPVPRLQRDPRRRRRERHRGLAGLPAGAQGSGASHLERRLGLRAGERDRVVFTEAMQLARGGRRAA